MKDLGETDVILGVKISRDNDSLILSQSHYIEKILKHYSMFDKYPANTPTNVSFKLILNTGVSNKQLEYPRVIGPLMYEMTCIKPNIAFYGW